MGNLPDDVSATDIDQYYGGAEENYHARIVVETIQDDISADKVANVIERNFQDLQDFNVLEVNLVDESGSSKIIQGTIDVPVVTTNKHMVEDVAADKIREYIPESYQVVDVTNVELE